MKTSTLVVTAFFLTGGFCPAAAANDRPIQVAAVAADNTGRNERDRSGATKTPVDQAENEADRTVTQEIRQAITADDSISTNGKNVKIVTVDGVVTLRGPVKSSTEKANIGNKARKVAGVKKVDNQLEIAK
jgi:hyperosmotically inducible periplasmic protein